MYIRKNGKIALTNEVQDKKMRKICKRLWIGVGTFIFLFIALALMI